MTQQQLTDLLRSMTLQEKIGQLVQLSGDFFGAGDLSTGPQAKLGIEPWVCRHAGSVLNVTGAEKVADIQRRHLEQSRIPLIFMADIVYGYRTAYPMPLALASSWEPELAKDCCRRTAAEAAPDGAHVTFAPMVDVSRDARWGRCMESPGEDTLLNSRFAAAEVAGFQEGLEEGRGMVSCVKHFAGYGAVEAGREYNTVDMSRWRMTQDYLPPYKAALDAGAKMVMTSFNTVEGVPATANRWLMQDVLREQWGFDGVLITDYAAIQELIAHGVAEDDREAARLGLEAGVDIDMKTPCYANQLRPLLENGEVSMEKVDAAVLRVLSLKNELGLFEDPYRGLDAAEAKRRAACPEDLAAARNAASKSMVLLKNEGLLPLKKGQKIALLGPYADSTDLIGSWAVYADKEKVITLRQAMEKELPAEDFAWETGCELLEDYSILGSFGSMLKAGPILKTSPEEALARSIELAQWADVVVFALGEHMLQSGESGSRTDLRLPKAQRDFLAQVLPHAKKSAVLLFNGHPMVLTDLTQKVDAILECWFPGTQGAPAAMDLLFGRANPSGRLTISFPETVGQVPIYYSGFMTGRPAKTSKHSGRFVSRYLDASNEPLYPFGYGLSYHTAEYSGISLSADTIRSGETVAASVTVTNMSAVAGEEVVQLYLHDVAASVVRPGLELKDFCKISLAPGETKTVSFAISEEMLRFYDQDLNYRAEPGRFEVYIGRSSADLEKAELRYLGE